MVLSRDSWEKVIKQSEAMIDDATLTVINADMMKSRAEEELKKFPKEDGSRIHNNKGTKKRS